MLGAELIKTRGPTRAHGVEHTGNVVSLLGQTRFLSSREGLPEGNPFR